VNNYFEKQDSIIATGRKDAKFQSEGTSRQKNNRITHYLHFHFGSNKLIKIYIYACISKHWR